MKSTPSYLFALAGLTFLCAACGASAPSKELLTARNAYANLNQGNTAQVNPAGAREAQEAMEKAEALHRDDAGSDREVAASYVAARKAELAVAQAEEARARQDREKADREYQSQLEQQLITARLELQAMQTASYKAEEEQTGWRKRGEDLVVTLSGVSFEVGSHELSQDAKQRLDVVARGLKERPGRAITVAGYTDSKGKPEGNRTLSQKRADAVKAYLESQGVPSSRIVSQGRGPNNPVASNKTEAGRAENRRVEITLHAQGAATSERQPVKGTDTGEIETQQR